MEKIAVKPGDFAVVLGQYNNVDCKRVERTTNALVFFEDKNWPRQARFPQIAFSGPAEIAKRLCEQLKSSAALHTEESSACHMRKAKRDQAFIDAATQAAK